MTALACVMPAFNEERFIAQVIADIPTYVDHIIVVNDGSTDRTRQVVEQLADPRLKLIDHASNQGVGGAVVSGYKEALRIGAEIIVKIDGDGQMDAGQIERLIAPISKGQADYSKGVRFRDVGVIKKMPLLRLVGNFGLSFLTKAASGYWDIFDPTNGFTAISRDALSRLSLDQLSEGFFFETDLLIHLYMIDAVVADVPTETRYGAEESHLNPAQAFLSFPLRLLVGTCKRILWRYFIRDFSAFSAFFLLGCFLFAGGAAFGLLKWAQSWLTGVPTPIGTVILAALPVILGFQLLLQAAVLDIQNVPKRPISDTWLTRSSDVAGQSR